MKTNVPLLLLAGALLSQCLPKAVEPEEKMPEATQTGLNTAGCRVDGQSWVARSTAPGFGGGTTPAVTATWRKVPGAGAHRLRLSFEKDIDQEGQVHDQTSVDMYLPDITRAGTFVFDQTANPRIVNGPTAYAAFTFSRPSPDQELLTGPATPGRLVVTRLDTLARVVSGTFEFEARQAGGTITVRVTDGRFDCKF